MNELFETNANNASPPPTVDAGIILTSTPHLQYEQIELDPNFRAYIESTLTTSSVLRIGIPKILYQKTFEVNVSSQSHIVDFKGANKQFSLISVSLVDDKSNEHINVCDSYNIESAN